MKYAYVVNNHFIGGDKLYCLDKSFPMGDLYRNYSWTWNGEGISWIGGDINYNPRIYFYDGISSVKVSAEFLYKYSVSTSALASSFSRHGINSANPNSYFNPSTPFFSRVYLDQPYVGQRPVFRCLSASTISTGLTLLSDDLNVPWSAISGEYMNNINTNNLTATIYDNNVYSALLSGELNRKLPTMKTFVFEDGSKIVQDGSKGFNIAKPTFTMQTNLYFSPLFDSYSSSPSWTYYSRS